MRRPELIPEWKKSPRMASQQLNAIGLAVLSLLTFVPEAAVFAWTALPAELRDEVPQHWMPAISGIFFAASMVARVIRQSGLHDETR